MRISDWSSDVCSSDLRSLPLEIGKDALGHLQRGIRHRYRVRAHLGLRTHQLGHRKRMLEQARQHRADRLDLAGKRVAVLHLAEHLRLAEDRKSTSELQSLMRISYAVFCLKKNTTHQPQPNP